MPGLPPALIERLGAARHLVVLTGSGVSAASGIPTFRSAGDGLWSRFRPEDLATPEAFERDPALVWQWYQWRRELINSSEPNAAHFAIAELARQLPQCSLITQNVDGLHQRSGVPDERIVELHGNGTYANIVSFGKEYGGDDYADESTVKGHAAFVHLK